MGFGNVRHRSARSKSHSFQYHIRLAGGMTYIRSHEEPYFLFKILRPVPQELRKNCEETPEAGVAVNVPEKTGLKADILSEVYIISVLGLYLAPEPAAEVGGVLREICSSLFFCSLEDPSLVSRPPSLPASRRASWVSQSSNSWFSNILGFSPGRQHRRAR